MAVYNAKDKPYRNTSYKDTIVKNIVIAPNTYCAFL